MCRFNLFVVCGLLSVLGAILQGCGEPDEPAAPPKVVRTGPQTELPVIIVTGLTHNPMSNGEYVQSVDKHKHPLAVGGFEVYFNKESSHNYFLFFCQMPNLREWMVASRANFQKIVKGNGFACVGEATSPSEAAETIEDEKPSLEWEEFTGEHNAWDRIEGSSSRGTKMLAYDSEIEEGAFDYWSFFAPHERNEL